MQYEGRRARSDAVQATEKCARACCDVNNAFNRPPRLARARRALETIRDAQMRDWFAAEDAHAPTRAQRFTRTGGGLTLDFSKNRITDQSFALLLQLAREAGVEQKRDAMFAGE